MTGAETVLWTALRGRTLGCRFRRQHPIGRYVVDFVCLRHRLVVECDGSQHFESRHDEIRYADLTRRGFRVTRFWNKEILGNLDVVLDTIAVHRDG